MARIRNNYKGHEYYSNDKPLSPAELENMHQVKYAKPAAAKKALRAAKAAPEKKK